MRVIGIDIGTTTICGVLVEADTGVLLDAVTLSNDTAMIEGTECEKEPVHLREHLQNPQKILDKCRLLIRRYLEKNEDIISIGVTGQMHGIVYTDVKGEAVSPLYTWQDQRGEESLGKDSYAEVLRQLTGYKMATGYGMVTHFYNSRNNLVDERAVSFCTIPDYIAMSLVGRKRPLVHQSMAASMGIYRLEAKEFDVEEARKAEMDTSKFPEVTDKNVCVGTLDFKAFGIETERNIKVSVALGDNQASFLGSVNGECNILLNVGTGSQISAYSENFVEGDSIECRPYLENSWILAGSSLCGGYAYSLVKKFAEEICYLTGIFKKPSGYVDFYEILNETARAVYDREERGEIKTPLIVDTRFRGTRKDSSMTGDMQNLTEETFHIGNISLGVLRGICEELYSYYTEFPKASVESTVFAGSGNGIRNNPLLQDICCDRFGMTMCIPFYSEEAAYGTALYSLLAAGYYKCYGDVRDLIKYL